MSSKLLFFLFSLFLLAGLVMYFPVKTAAATFEDQIVGLINTERQKTGLTPYSNNDKLFQASSNHNNTMSSCAKTYGVNSCFVHQVTLVKEANFFDRIKATGYNPQSASENIAWGYTTPQSVVAGWMGSSGHKANILGNYKDVGCDYLDSANGSYQGMYWTCDFGKSLNNASVMPTPTVRPTATPTPTPTSAPSMTPTPTAGSSATPMPIMNPSKPWWCQYVPNNSYCK